MNQSELYPGAFKDAVAKIRRSKPKLLRGHDFSNPLTEAEKQRAVDVLNRTFDMAMIGKRFVLAEEESR